MSKPLERPARQGQPSRLGLSGSLQSYSNKVSRPLNAEIQRQRAWAHLPAASLEIWLHFEFVGDEGPAVRRFLNDLRRRLARAMSRFGFDADQHGVLSRVSLLEGRGELEAVRGNDTVIVIGRGDQGRRIARARFQVLQR